MIKKLSLLATILLTTMTTSSFATEKIILLNYSKPGSLNYTMLENIKENAKGFDYEIVNVSNCAEAALYIKNTNQPVVAAWDITTPITAEINKDDACNMLNQDTFLTVYGDAYFKICRHQDKKNNTLEKLLNGTALVGAWNGYVNILQLNAILDKLNKSAKSVPYPSANDQWLALETGEVDFLFTTRPKENMECVISMDPNETSLPKASSYFDNVFSNASYTMALIGKNLQNKEKIKEDIVETTESERWTTGSTKIYSNETAKLSIEDQYKKIVNYLNAVRKSIQ